MTKLVIVESPAKTKSIGKYLGNDYLVVSSKGHIRDLSTRGKFGFGVDIENHFKPDYVTIKGKKKVIDELKKDVKKTDFVYLATDPDREGEAISWHLFDVLGLKENEYDRIVFNEITKNAVVDSLNHARKIDQNLVNSQETRRILDRIIGFRLSKLVQNKTSGTSAGRVQSVALKLVVDREREIEALGHDIINHEALQATCENIGHYAYQTCSRCDYTTYEEIPALGHDYHIVIINPTKQQDGYTIHRCNRCSESYTDNYTTVKSNCKKSSIATIIAMVTTLCSCLYIYRSKKN